MFHRCVGALVGLAMMGMAGTANAILFDISWTGAGGYTMDGMFGYNDALIGTGAINETQIDSLMIEVFLSGASQGTWDLVADGDQAGAFNFNFDTTTLLFAEGGFSDSSTGQDWNVIGGEGCGAFGGFASGIGGQGVCLGGSFVSASFDRDMFSLVASTKVVEPPTLALFAIGLAGLGFMRRRRKRAA